MIGTIHELKSNEYGNSQIARGAFGSVSIAILQSKEEQEEQHKKKNEQQSSASSSSSYSFVAIKTISNAVIHNSASTDVDTDKPKLSLAVFSELAALRVLSSSQHQHENITPLLSTATPSSSSKSTASSYSFSHSHDISFIFPYCPIDLNEIIQSRRFHTQTLTSATVTATATALLPLPLIRTIFQDILRGLHHIHSIGIIHADIKPGNILLSSRGFFQLADFGLAQLQTPVVVEASASPPVAVAATGMCTLPYRPPELLFATLIYKPSIDIWGAGLILCEMLSSGRPLFNGTSVLDQLSHVMDVLGVPTTDTWEGIQDLPDYGKVVFHSRTGFGFGMVLNLVRDDEVLERFVEAMVVMDPEKRWSAEECLGHEWMDNDCGVWTREDICEELIPKEYRSCYDGYGDGDFSGETKAHLLEQMKLDAVEIARMKRQMKFGPCKGRGKGGDDDNDDDIDIEISSSLPALLALKLQAL